MPFLLRYAKHDVRTSAVDSERVGWRRGQVLAGAQGRSVHAVPVLCLTVAIVLELHRPWLFPETVYRHSSSAGLRLPRDLRNDLVAHTTFKTFLDRGGVCNLMLSSWSRRHQIRMTHIRVCRCGQRDCLAYRLLRLCKSIMRISDEPAHAMSCRLVPLCSGVSLRLRESHLPFPCSGRPGPIRPYRGNSALFRTPARDSQFSRALPSPDPTHTESVEHRVDRDNGNISRQSLSGEHPVEWIAMRAGQAPCAFSIGGVDCQLHETLPGDVTRDINGDGLAPRQLADPEFRGDLPGGRGADQDVVQLVRNQLARRTGKAPAIREPPQKRMGVQQCRHCYRPSHAVSSSSGRGSKKVSGTTIFPLRTSG